MTWIWAKWPKFWAWCAKRNQSLHLKAAVLTSGKSRSSKKYKGSRKTLFMYVHMCSEVLQNELTFQLWIIQFYVRRSVSLDKLRLRNMMDWKFKTEDDTYLVGKTMPWTSKVRRHLKCLHGRKKPVRIFPWLLMTQPSGRWVPVFGGCGAVLSVPSQPS